MTTYEVNWEEYDEMPVGNALALGKIATSGDVLEKLWVAYGHCYVIQGWIGNTFGESGPTPVLGCEEGGGPTDDELDEMSVEDLGDYVCNLTSEQEIDGKQVSGFLFEALFARVAMKLVGKILEALLERLADNLGGDDE